MIKESRKALEEHLERCDKELLKSCFFRSKTTTPVSRFYKTPQCEALSQIKELHTKEIATTLLLGDSIIKGLSRYPEVWENFFAKTDVNC